MFRVDVRNVSKLFALSMVFLISLSLNPTSGYLLTNTYTNLNGQSISFQEFEGTMLFVEAFQTTCGACIREHDELVKLYNEFDTQITMLTLSVFGQDTLGSLNEYVKVHPTAWKIGLDEGRIFEDIFNIKSTPTMILFNQEGRLLTQKVAFTEYEELSSIVSQYLAIGNPQPGDKIDGYEGGESSGSLIEDLFGSNLFRISFFTVLVIMVYVKMTGTKAVA